MYRPQKSVRLRKISFEKFRSHVCSVPKEQKLQFSESARSFDLGQSKSASSPNAPVTTIKKHSTQRFAMEITWSCSFPILSPAQEQRARSIVFPGSECWSKRDWGAEPTDYHKLELEQRTYIERSASAATVNIAQIKKIRSAILLNQCPWKFSGANVQEIRERKSKLFEMAIGRHLTTCGVAFQTEAQQRVEQLQKTYRLKATPDFLLERPCRINGVVCNWVEVKGIYGCGFWEEMKSWNPSKKCFAQVQRYTEQFGPGALVLKYGFGDRFRAQVCDGVLLLDASPVLLPGYPPDQAVAIKSDQAQHCPVIQKRKSIPLDRCPCGYYRHPQPPRHFSKKDRRHCCRCCRLSNGKRHGGHCLGL